jgi:uncharacterized protein (DUF608 family)
MNPCWPILRTYDVDHLRRISMPVGGIGTGCIGLGGRGDLRNWELVNRSSMGFRPARCFFAIRAQPSGGEPISRVLEGPIDPADYEGAAGTEAANHGLPRFRNARFHAAYPFGQVELTDGGLPVDVTTEAFNPLIPGDADASGLPFMMYRVRVTNPTAGPVSITVCGSMTNFIGTDGVEGSPAQNTNAFRNADGVAGIFMTSPTMAADSPVWGTMALVTPDVQNEVSYRTDDAAVGWQMELLQLWEELDQKGRLTDVPATAARKGPNGALAVGFTVAPGATETATFIIAWHFPNRLSWTPEGKSVRVGGGKSVNGLPIIGNYYTTQCTDAWDAAAKAARQLPELERRTVAFAKAVCDSDFPAVVKEAALFNLSTLKTQTVFRTPDGRFFGYEGAFEQYGSCPGSCTHVWNYEQATGFLFGVLARDMRDTEYKLATDDTGVMSFRIFLPLQYAQAFGVATADGQMGTLMRLYRDWQLSGDDAWLRSIWPYAKRTMEYSWLPGGWDADRDGVMEGCQHNTMDVEYYGPNPQMTGWYLGALRACERMARHLGDNAFADECQRLFESGSRKMDATLFNGEYYEHHIQPSTGPVPKGSRHGDVTAIIADPKFQLGAGCLIDQLVGQFMAHICGLGHLHDPANIRKTLASILKYNRKRGFFDLVNPMRSFVAGDEEALLMAHYPAGKRPRVPFPYYAEVMTGFEYTVGIGLIQEGMVDEGVAVIDAIRDRYDGRRRNPFDEAECGRHYARAMIAWGAIVALSGFQYDAISATLHFAATAKPATFFWSNRSAWGTFAQSPTSDGAADIVLTVLSGSLKVSTIQLGEGKTLKRPAATVIKASEPLRGRVEISKPALARS